MALSKSLTSKLPLVLPGGSCRGSTYHWVYCLVCHCSVCWLWLRVVPQRAPLELYDYLQPSRMILLNRYHFVSTFNNKYLSVSIHLANLFKLILKFHIVKFCRNGLIFYFFSLRNFRRYCTNPCISNNLYHWWHIFSKVSLVKIFIKAISMRWGGIQSWKSPFPV